MQGIDSAYVPFDEAAGGLPDVGEISRAMSDRARALVLVAPNNPCGAEYPADWIEHVFELACDRGITLVIDETYDAYLRFAFANIAASYD